GTGQYPCATNSRESKASPCVAPLRECESSSLSKAHSPDLAFSPEPRSPSLSHSEDSHHTLSITPRLASSFVPSRIRPSSDGASRFGPFQSDLQTRWLHAGLPVPEHSSCRFVESVPPEFSCRPNLPLQLCSKRDQSLRHAHTSSRCLSALAAICAGSMSTYRIRCRARSTSSCPLRALHPPRSEFPSNGRAHTILSRAKPLRSP